MPNCELRSAISGWLSRSFNNPGAELISELPCEITGGITTAIKKETKARTPTNMAPTALTRERPRFLSASTAGFKPIAR